ncbi:hypothetical protein DPMN_156326 [Dreissena polymorpha]|uniref:Uncharacterized protein n=1 Tax=Dreissena polymorpha TaxID=45954 RepID=A0A9D4FSY6_DREPO|nr:hypothetical protein DPMN_156326 [Dreissena polymorpha]
MILPIKCCIPTKNEIRRKIKLLKNSKFAGSDNVPANVLKADVKISLELLFSLFIQLLEKGDFSSCSNYRRDYAVVHLIKGA